MNTECSLVWLSLLLTVLAYILAGVALKRNTRARELIRRLEEKTSTDKRRDFDDAARKNISGVCV